jgi:hypothetical protein
MSSLFYYYFSQDDSMIPRELGGAGPPKAELVETFQTNFQVRDKTHTKPPGEKMETMAKHFTVVRVSEHFDSDFDVDFSSPILL